MKSRFTILFIPPGHAPARQITIPLKSLRFIISGLFVLGMLIIGSFSYNGYLIHIIKLQETDFKAVDQIKMANQSKDQEINRLREEALKATQDLARIHDLELKISMILKINPKATQISRGLPTTNTIASASPHHESISNQLIVLEQYHDLLERNRFQIDHTPSILPVDAEIASPFGKRKNPFGGWSTEFHNGIDFAVGYGAPVQATAAGIVTFAGWDPVYGRRVDIDHGNGIVTYYAHNSRLQVSVNQSLQKGDIIAYSGNSGRSTGAHLHYGAFLNGQSIDPLSFTNYIKEQ